jgi:putative selenate reductase
MTPIPLPQFINWIFSEYERTNTIFGIPSVKFFYSKSQSPLKIFSEAIETPLGPAAGPHTQLAQNILVSYLTGGRFFELKTVQQLDELVVDKPCIDAQDEGYNVEWSQELTLSQSYEEYLKAWFALHLLNELFHFSSLNERGFVFNMSVGYTLDGIKTEKMNAFIENLKDASSHPLFKEYKSIVRNELAGGQLAHFSKNAEEKKRIRESIDNISPFISKSVTLSTMHGCPPHEIEAIAKYLIRDKGLHTYIKLNPTLLGFDAVHDMLRTLGYIAIDLDKNSFDHDLQFIDAIPMLRRLKEFAAQNGKEFGVKLSNTLGVKNTRKVLAGDQMYMSGRSLFPLTVNLAYRLAEVFDGALNISYSGGATQHNVASILETGIAPITMVTDLLKPGGYERLSQMAEIIGKTIGGENHRSGTINLSKLKQLAAEALTDKEYQKSRRGIDSVKIPKTLEKFDCYIAPCAVACPIHQDVAEYIRLVEEERYADAFEVIVAKNPLPHITGYICDHQCMNKCTRWDYDDPVQIRDLKKVAAENGFDEYLKRFKSDFSAKKNNIPVAIIGAGPSGLTAAYFLAKSGFDVTIYEKSDKAGGTVQHVIPEFRLPQSAIDDDIAFIKQHGVKFQFGSAQDFSVNTLKTNGFKYIYLAIGAPESNQLQLTGNNETILDAVDFLKLFNKKDPVKLGKNVAIIGGGNSAMDSARAAKRIAGVEKVYLIYRRTKEFMPADMEEFDAAVDEGAIFRELLAPVDLTGRTLKCQRMKLAEPDSSGRRNVVPVESQYETFNIDTVISAIGEHVDLDLLRRNSIALDGKNKAKVESTTNETMVESVYIGGDALRGPSTVVESIADGKKAAEAIIRKAQVDAGEELNLETLFQSDERLKNLLRTKGTILSNVKEAGNAFLPAKEASRCLGCSFVCDKCVEVCPNRANIALASGPTGAGFKNIAQILHIDGLCNECGNCETFCPYSSGSPYKTKTTLFWTEKELLESGNDGFFVESQDHSLNILNAIIRYNGETGTITCNSQGGILRSSLNHALRNTEFMQFTKLMATVATQYSYLLNTAITFDHIC